MKLIMMFKGSLTTGLMLGLGLLNPRKKESGKLHSKFPSHLQISDKTVDFEVLYVVHCFV